MDRFKVSKWVARTVRGGRTRRERQVASRYVGHREHRYWSRGGEGH